MTEPLRLAKRLSRMLPCSRREAELYITGSWVRVDGVVVDEPQFRGVEVAGTIAPGGLELLQHGLSFEGRALTRIKANWQNENRLRFALKNPRPGQLHSMCEQVGLQLVALKRIRIGRLPMAKLPSGQWRYMDARERF